MFFFYFLPTVLVNKVCKVHAFFLGDPFPFLLSLYPYKSRFASARSLKTKLHKFYDFYELTRARKTRKKKIQRTPDSCTQLGLAIPQYAVSACATALPLNFSFSGIVPPKLACFPILLLAECCTVPLTTRSALFHFISFQTTRFLGLFAGVHYIALVIFCMLVCLLKGRGKGERERGTSDPAGVAAAPPQRHKIGERSSPLSCASLNLITTCHAALPFLLFSSPLFRPPQSLAIVEEPCGGYFLGLCCCCRCCRFIFFFCLEWLCLAGDPRTWSSRFPFSPYPQLFSFPISPPFDLVLCFNFPLCYLRSYFSRDHFTEEG